MSLQQSRPVQAGPNTATLRLGAAGEEFVAGQLRAAGWHILARNYRNQVGEIDLIVRCPAGELVSVEVKTRRNADVIGGIESVDQRKLNRLHLVLRHWAHAHGLAPVPFRVDVVEVVGTPGGLRLAGHHREVS